jgi:hypothetical protein
VARVARNRFKAVPGRRNLRSECAILLERSRDEPRALIRNIRLAIPSPLSTSPLPSYPERISRRASTLGAHNSSGPRVIVGLQIQSAKFPAVGILRIAPFMLNSHGPFRCPQRCRCCGDQNILSSRTILLTSFERVSLQ